MRGATFGGIEGSSAVFVSSRDVDMSPVLEMSIFGIDAIDHGEKIGTVNDGIVVSSVVTAGGARARKWKRQTIDVVDVEAK